MKPFWRWALIVFIFACLMAIYFYSPPSQTNNLTSNSSPTVKNTKLNPKANQLAHEPTVKNEEEKTSSTKLQDPAEDPCWLRVIDQIGGQTFVDSKLKQIGQATQPWLTDRKSRESSPQITRPLKFFKALAQAGLLDGREWPLDEKQALTDLQTVSDEAPDNSAYLIYMAIILERQGKTKEVSDLIEKIKKTKYFKSGVTSITRSIYEQVNDVTDFIPAISAAASMPIPKYDVLKNFIVNHQLGLIAEQILVSNYSEKPQNELLDFVLIEYAIAQGALKKMNIPSKYPETKTYMRKMNSRSALWQAEVVMDELSKSCDARSFEPFLEKLKIYLKENPSSF